MKIYIDGIIYSLQKSGGISIYFDELLKTLSTSQHDVKLTTYGKINIKEISVDQKACVARILERYRKCVIDEAIDIFHSSYYRLPDRSNARQVVTVHDFIYEKYRRGIARFVHCKQKYTAIENAHSIICISESTRSDLFKYVNLKSHQKVYVIPNGVASDYVPLTAPTSYSQFFLYVGSRVGYKNFKLALRVLDLFKDFKLVCVGGGEFSKSELSGFSQSVVERIIHLPSVDNNELNDLYNSAYCLLYTSLSEGFGIPVAEAMKAGCPVACSDAEAILEVSGGASVVISNLDTQGLNRALSELSDSSFRTDLINAGFSLSRKYDWLTTHSETINVYHETISL